MKIILKQALKWILQFSFHVLVYSIASIISIYLSLKIIYQWWKYPAKNLTKKRRELPPASLNDPAYGEHSYIQIKNIKLHYVENGDNSKPLMLFLHGFPDFWYSWRHQLKYFSKHYWTVAVDMRGYGDSEKPSGSSQYRIKYLLSDVKNLIQALGKENCILVGHDWGSIVGWYFILKYPDLVDKYVMIGMYPLFARYANWRQYVKTWNLYGLMLPYLPELYLQRRDCRAVDYIFRKQSEEEKEVYKFVFGKPGAFICPINYVKANAYRLVFSIRKKAKDTQLPKGLLVYTDDDDFVDMSNFNDAEKIVENLSTVFIKSASHFIHQRKPDETNKFIAKFLGVDVTEGSGNTKSVQLSDCET